MQGLVFACAETIMMWPPWSWCQSILRLVLTCKRRITLPAMSARPASGGQGYAFLLSHLSSAESQSCEKRVSEALCSKEGDRISVQNLLNMTQIPAQ